MFGIPYSGLYIKQVSDILELELEIPNPFLLSGPCSFQYLVLTPSVNNQVSILGARYVNSDQTLLCALKSESLLSWGHRHVVF